MQFALIASGLFVGAAGAIGLAFLAYRPEIRRREDAHMARVTAALPRVGLFGEYRFRFTQWTRDSNTSNASSRPSPQDKAGWERVQNPPLPELSDWSYRWTDRRMIPVFAALIIIGAILGTVALVS